MLAEQTGSGSIRRPQEDATLLFASETHVAHRVSWDQTNLATITGAITDAPSASIPGASVEATNVATGVVYLGSASDAGIYTIPLVPAGSYTVSVLKEGFQGSKSDSHIKSALLFKCSSRACRYSR
jgi:hypothetical protein